MDQRDYYQILGVDADQSQQQIKDAYRRMALKYHPDRNKDNPAVAETMKEINEAYAVLSDPKKRREYDSLRQQYGDYAYDRFRQGYSEQDIFRGSDINQIFEEMARAFGLSGFDAIFREFYGTEYRSFEFHRPGFTGRGFVYFSPLGRRPQHPQQGAGERRYDLPSLPLGGIIGKAAKYLLKKMWAVEWPERGKDLNDVITIDPMQALMGAEIRYYNRGRSKDLLVKVPPGTRDGQRIRLKGMGGNGKGGEESGDLYLRIQVKKPLLRRIKDFFQ
ncbi:MAG: DnaJ domain-containing protein [Deltaproteobacteria bacterium]|nr:DnaJ domain-containing protein [Deltaproteobacteria bacterium]